MKLAFISVVAHALVQVIRVDKAKDGILSLRLNQAVKGNIKVGVGVVSVADAVDFLLVVVSFLMCCLVYLWGICRRRRCDITAKCFVDMAASSIAALFFFSLCSTQRLHKLIGQCGPPLLYERNNSPSGSKSRVQLAHPFLLHGASLSTLQSCGMRALLSND